MELQQQQLATELVLELQVFNVSPLSMLTNPPACPKVAHYQVLCLFLQIGVMPKFSHDFNFNVHAHLLKHCSEDSQMSHQEILTHFHTLPVSRALRVSSCQILEDTQDSSFIGI